MTAPEGLLSRIRSGLPGLAWPPIVAGPLASLVALARRARGKPPAAGGRNRGPAASPARGPGDPCGSAFTAFRPPAGGGGAGAPRSRNTRGTAAPARAAPARDPAGGIGFPLLRHPRRSWAAVGEPHLRLHRRAGDDPADGGQPAFSGAPSACASTPGPAAISASAAPRSASTIPRSGCSPIGGHP